MFSSGKHVVVYVTVKLQSIGFKHVYLYCWIIAMQVWQNQEKKNNRLLLEITSWKES